MGRLGCRRGQSAVMYAVAATTMFGTIGLVVDIGWAYYRKQVLQTVADATATAAASAAYEAAGGTAPSCSTTGVSCNDTTCPSSIATPANNLQKGCMYAYANGVVPGPKLSVVLQAGTGAPPTAPGAQMNYWVTARVSERIPQLFSVVVGRPELTVTSRATTAVRQATSGGCIFVLDPAAAGAVSMVGTTDVTTNCGIFINSNHPYALTGTGNATIRTNNGGRVRIVGNWNGGGNVIPAPVTGVGTATDPLEDMAPPPDASCTSSGVYLGSHDKLSINPTTHGVICNGITLDAQSSLTMAPGLYIVKGGISLGGQTTITGDGVTIYLDSGGVNMAGGAAVSLRAPSTGDWQGILLFQNRTNTNPSTLVGGTGQQMNGVIYVPAANLTYTGGSGTTVTATTLVAKTLTMVGTSYIDAAATTQYMGMQGGVFPVE